jgi:hypothetical protein
MNCPSAPAYRTMAYTDALSQVFYGKGWTLTPAAGDYAVDDGVDSAWMDRNNVPHRAGHDTRGLLHPWYQGGQPVSQLNEGSGAGWADYNSEFYTDGDYSPNEHTNWSSNDEIYSFHSGGANHVFADGSVHFVKRTTAPSVFVALISPSGAEVISADSY